MYLTPEKLLNLHIDLTALDADSEALKKLIEDDKEAKQPMRDGVQYFKVNNTEILSKDFTEYFPAPSETASDDNASNNKLLHAFHRKMVNQKVEIILSNGVLITFSKDESGKTIEQVTKTLGTNFDVLLINWAKGASNKGIEWVVPYVNTKGLLKFKVIDAREVVPIYSNDDPEDLLQVIRYYYQTTLIDGGSRSKLIVEIWNKKDVEVWEEQTDGSLKKLDNKPHFTFTREINGKIVESEDQSWGRVPFIGLLNNNEMMTDLEPVKSEIDDYDLHTSDNSNSLIDVADAIWVLENYSGQDLSEFRKNIKQFKSIPVDTDGGAEPKTLELPSDARDAHLKRNKENIYSLGSGVDTIDAKFGESPSGIALLLMYSDVITKGNTMLRYLESSLYDLLWFVNRYYEIVNSKKSGSFEEFDPQDASFTFKLALPVNEKEVIEGISKSVGNGVISKQTLREKDPRIKDQEEEVRRLEAEAEDGLEDFNNLENDNDVNE